MNLQIMLGVRSQLVSFHATTLHDPILRLQGEGFPPSPRETLTSLWSVPDDAELGSIMASPDLIHGPESVHKAFFLEIMNLGPCPEPSRSERGDDLVDFGFLDFGAAKKQKIASHEVTSSERATAGRLTRTEDLASSGREGSKAVTGLKPVSSSTSILPFAKGSLPSSVQVNREVIKAHLPSPS